MQRVSRSRIDKFDEGPKSSLDYTSETSKCDTCPSLPPLQVCVCLCVCVCVLCDRVASGTSWEREDAFQKECRKKGRTELCMPGFCGHGDEHLNFISR